MVNPSRLLCTLGFSLSLISAAGAVGTRDTQIYGSYNLGCIANAQAFPLQGEHYVTQQWGPKRNYAAPQMIDYLTKLTARAKEAGLPPLIIGDLSAPRGGPYGKSNHASHMIGLDVDIPFGFAPDLPRTLTTPQSFYLVRNGRLTDSFDAERIKLIYLAHRALKRGCVNFTPMIRLMISGCGACGRGLAIGRICMCVCPVHPIALIVWRKRQRRRAMAVGRSYAPGFYRPILMPRR